MNFGAIGAIFGFFAVVLGAFGAHALKTQINPEMLEIFKTGVEYQFFHAITLLALARSRPSRRVLWAGRFFVLGILIFSGSLYILSLSGVRAWGAITPIGGVSFLLGWALTTWNWIQEQTK